MNVPGSYSCSCLPGYVGDGVFTCDGKEFSIVGIFDIS